MTSDHVNCTVDGHVATVTLCNARRYNAMTKRMWLELAQIMQQLATNREVRVVVLRGEGEKAFVSGADISEFDEQRNDPASGADYEAAVVGAQIALKQFPRPVIAAISGICYGGGLELALACDLRYAEPGARFRMPAARLGLGLGVSSLAGMAAVLGLAHAAEMYYTARVYDAAGALRLCIVQEITDDVFARAAQVAEEIATNAPLTIAAGKLAFNTIRAAAMPTDVLHAQQAAMACITSSDYAEGRKAFAEKRTPSFRGH